MAVRKVTKKQIHGLLLESVFNPKDQTPFSNVVAMNNPEYAELKAGELILEASAAFKMGHLSTYHDKMAKAISLLALARAERATFPAEETR